MFSTKHCFDFYDKKVKQILRELEARVSKVELKKSRAHARMYHRTFGKDNAIFKQHRLKRLQSVSLRNAFAYALSCTFFSYQINFLLNLVTVLFKRKRPSFLFSPSNARIERKETLHVI